MSDKEKKFTESTNIKVTPDLVPANLRTGTWRCYSDYLAHPSKKGERSKADAYVEAVRQDLTAPDVYEPKMYVYPPLIAAPGLFLEFARLWDGGVLRGVWRDWIGTKGVLGLNDGDVRGGPRETHSAFEQEAREAQEILRLYEAAENPDGADNAYIRQHFYPMGPPAEHGSPRQAALWVVGVRVQKKLVKECFPQIYLNEDGTSVLSYGFRSLLGAMYLQMASLLTNGTAAVKWCKAPGCNKTIDPERRSHAEVCPGKACEMRWRRANGKA